MKALGFGIAVLVFSLPAASAQADGFAKCSGVIHTLAEYYDHASNQAYENVSLDPSDCGIVNGWFYIDLTHNEIGASNLANLASAALLARSNVEVHYEKYLDGTRGHKLVFLEIVGPSPRSLRHKLR